MTTKLIVKNGASSNGDVHLNIKGSALDKRSLLPGESTVAWISTGHEIDIKETYPTQTPASTQAQAGELADELIAKEVAVQDAMWGGANERADSTENQLLAAAQAQLALTTMILDGHSAQRATAHALLDHYPEDWEGLRSYGSTVANLVVAVAFLRSEIKRRILLGESTTRTKRGEPYNIASPYMSAEEAAAK